jgi:hypothetical protein
MSRIPQFILALLMLFASCGCHPQLEARDSPDAGSELDESDSPGSPDGDTTDFEGNVAAQPLAPCRVVRTGFSGTLNVDTDGWETTLAHRQTTDYTTSGPGHLTRISILSEYFEGNNSSLGNPHSDVVEITNDGSGRPTKFLATVFPAPDVGEPYEYQDRQIQYADEPFTCLLPHLLHTAGWVSADLRSFARQSQLIGRLTEGPCPVVVDTINLINGEIQRTEIEYDELHRVSGWRVWQVDETAEDDGRPQGQIEVEYGPNSLPLRNTDAGGQLLAEYHYNDAGLVEEVETRQQTLVFERDERQRIVALRKPAQPAEHQLEWRIEYNDNDSILRIIEPSRDRPGDPAIVNLEFDYVCN